MTYEQFLEETNLLNSKYELDRQELADKYASDVEKLSNQKDKAVAKLFEEYKKAKKEADEKAFEDNSK
jgi:hypothetical protein